MPPDDQVVVRFGEMKPESLRDSAEIAFAKTGRYSLSFWSIAGASASELALKVAITIDRTGGVFRASTIGRLREGGFELVEFQRNGHCTLVLDDLPSSDDCEALRTAFDEPIANPYRR